MRDSLENTRSQRVGFGNITLPYLDELYSAAVRLAPDRSEAEELVLRVYEKAGRHPAWLHMKTSMRTRLYSLLMECSFSESSRIGNVPLPGHNDGSEPQEDFFFFNKLLEMRIDQACPSPAFPVEQLTEDKIRNALSLLPARLRSIVVLCDFQELTHSETSEALRIPMESVRTMLRHGRNMLQKALWDEYTGTVCKNSVALVK